MPRVAAWECSDNRSAQSREGLPPEFGKDADVCRWRPTRADPLLSRSPYWWRRRRQTHLLPIGIATASPSRRFRYERNRRPRPLVPRIPAEMLTVLTHREIIPRRPDWDLDSNRDPVIDEPPTVRITG